ncbi:hypothetical protein DDD_2960 [Nonlabens dokdonensis DSW-6]|uniref:Uncharacterized protein n=1 Tax=Nonlabens dokdonensis (strain DSM 17205 / KCTC 12402 / DSW-6) TaxID=592029 RepID=L7WCW2_NONDD|nr:hypothetical protein DDD_2960 [Nonlabens dokdonensis DSW-6]
MRINTIKLLEKFRSKLFLLVSDEYAFAKALQKEDMSKN